MLENIVMGIKFDPREVILHHEEGVDVIPSNKLLSGLDVSLIMAEDREIILREYLMLLKEDYDFMIIDCMPSLGMLTINALTAADSILIPMEPEYDAADGLMELLKVYSCLLYTSVPKEITAGCGMAWMTPLENEESVVQFMSEHEIIPQGVFQVEI